jgi:signal transduction histidine kinase
MLDRSLAPIVGDSIALQEVLLNLVMNAREAMTGGGTIRIETEPLSDHPGWIRLTVSDTGAGIAPEAIVKLFDPFYTNKTSGTGLGLWISKRIVRDHGGTIDVQSEPGRGASFVMTFPCMADPERAGDSA